MSDGNSYDTIYSNLSHIKAVADLMINNDPDNQMQPVGSLFYSLAEEVESLLSETARQSEGGTS